MAISSKALAAGTILEIAVQGTKHIMRVLEINDGRVVLARTGDAWCEQRWWLPYQFVRENAWLAAIPAPTDARSVAIRRARESGDTLAAIGARFGITRERVRQILKKFPSGDPHGD